MERKSIVPSIPVELDRVRYLKMTNWAKCRAERELCDYWQRDISLYDALLRQPMRVNDLAILFWAALLEDDPTLTIRDAMEYMDMHEPEVVMNLVLRAWNISTPTEEESSEGSGASPFADVSTGTVSGALPAANSD